MAVKTYSEQLEQVQAAIDAIETRNQSYTIGSRTVTRANLRELYQREAYLRRRVDRETRGGVRVRYGTAS